MAALIALLAPYANKFIGYIIAAFVLTAAILGLVTYIHVLQGDLIKSRTQAATAHAVATVAAGQATAGQAATTTLDAGTRRDSITVNLQEAHAKAIAAAPGADDTVAADLGGVALRGLCEYAVYKYDPSCAGLRGAHPAVVPPAGTGGSAAPANR